MMKKFLPLFALSLFSISLLAQIPDGYYDPADGLTGDALKTALHNIIDDHTELSYTAVKEALKDTDEDENNSDNIICLYTGWSKAKTDFGNGNDQWNREHTWSKSHGDFGDVAPAGTDLHHLRPTDVTVNSAKSNRDFDYGTTEYFDASVPTGCYYDDDIWTPRHEVRGDVARMIFYMATRYEGGSGEPDLEIVDYVDTAPNNEPYYGKLSTLLVWHITDPVDDWERNRNDVIYYDYQSNRNPFIDHPEYVEEIWGAYPSISDLMLSEITHPSGSANSKFVELYNGGSDNIDFSSQPWYLSRQSNGGTTWGDVQLSGSINTGETFVLSTDVAIFFTSFGINADMNSGVVNGNGDDGYFLYYGGEHEVGTLIDAFGEIDIDGSGEAWEYTNSKAVRVRSVAEPRTDWTADEWIIPATSATADMTPAAHNENLVWAGTTSSDWHTLSNWAGSPLYLPNISYNISIPDVTTDPAINGDAICYGLTLQSSASLDVSVGGTLTVYEDLSIADSKSRAAASFVVDGDAAGNGSVIVEGTITGDAVVNRYFEGYNDGALNGWHLIGSPVNDIIILSTDFDPTATLNDLYQWNESDDIWKNYKQDHFTNFTNGYGYLSAFESTDTRSFTGTLNNTDIGISGLSLSADGWHVLGNPFPSAIEWNTSDWGVSGIGSTAQVRNEQSGNYLPISSGGIIPSTNGFFVEVSNATNSLTIPASARIHDATNNYKNEGVEELDETLVLKITNDENSYYDLSRIGFKAEATEAWDSDFDAHKLFGEPTAPQLWTVSNNELFAHNYLPYMSESHQLPLHFKAGVNSTYHIDAAGLGSFFGDIDIFLEDLFTEKIINLRDQQLYTFQANVEDDEARFVIHFYGVSSTGNLPGIEANLIYSHQNTIYIKSNDQQPGNYLVEVVNVMGQQVYKNEFSTAGLNSFQLNNKPGIYFVRLHTGNITTVKKIMINN